MTDLADKYHFTYEDIVTPVLSTLTDNQAPFIQLLTDLSGAQTTGPQALMTKDFLKMLESEQLFLGLVSMTNVILLMSIFYWKS